MSVMMAHFLVLGYPDPVGWAAHAHGVESVHGEGLHRGDAPSARGLREPRRQRGFEHQGLGQEQHAEIRRCDGVQEGHDAGPDARVRRADPGLGHPERDQGGLLTDRFRALRPVGLPDLEVEVEDACKVRSVKKIHMNLHARCVLQKKNINLHAKCVP